MLLLKTFDLARIEHCSWMGNTSTTSYWRGRGFKS